MSFGAELGSAPRYDNRWSGAAFQLNLAVGKFTYLHLIAILVNHEQFPFAKGHCHAVSPAFARSRT